MTRLSYLRKRRVLNLQNNKINAKIINKLPLVICLAAVILPLYLFFKNDYYYQYVDLKRIEKIELAEDITTIRDFQPEGMKVKWSRSEVDFRGEPAKFIEMLTTRHNPSETNVLMTLYRDREKAAQGYISQKNKKFNRTQAEKTVNPSEKYFISKVRRLREAHFAGLVKTNQYHSEVVFVKNNLVVTIYSFNYNDNTGSSKQAVIDIIADYLEKKAAEEKTP